MNTGRILLVSATSTLAMLSAVKSYAQSAGAPSSQPVVDTLQEVVVTAQKREERLIDVPSTVSALSGRDLVDTQAVHFTDYLSRVPNVSFYSQQEGYTQPQIRGIVTGANSSTTGIYIDETPYGSSTGYSSAGVLTPDLDPDDLQRVEVLSGPQGTLYGANSLGGLIKFVTTPPDLRRYSARASAEYSSVDGGGDGYAVRGMLNVPIVDDKLALRVSAFSREDPGYIKNTIIGQSNNDATYLEGYRLSALWKPTDKISVTGLYLSQDLRNNNEPSEDVNKNLTPLYGDRIERRYADEIGKDRYHVGSVSVGYDLGWAKLLETTSYSTLTGQNRSDQSNNGDPGLLDAVFHQTDLSGYFGVNTQTERLTEEARLQSPTGHFLEWQAGFYYDHQRNNQFQNFQPIVEGTGAAFPTPFLENNVLLAQYLEYSGYADLRINITDKFDVLLGGRYSTNDQHFSLIGSGLIQAPSNLTRTSSDDTFTWLFNPRYRITKDLMVYARIASGYAPGGPNPVVPGAPAAVPTAFQPETIVSYEGGVKSTFLDGKASVAFDGFYIDWSDIQLGTNVTVSNAQGGQQSYFVDENGGKASSKGVEFTSTYTPLRGLSLTGSVGYVDATLSKDAPGIGGVKGDRIARVPNVNAAIGADYRWTVGDVYRPFVGLNWRFIGDSYSDYSNVTSRVLLPDYDVLDLRVGIDRGPLELTVFAKNVNNSGGITYLTVINPGVTGGYDAASLIQPRTFGLNVTARF